MKKLMKSLMLFAAAAMALTSCENEAMNEGIEANETFTLSFTAGAPESKTSVNIEGNNATFSWSEGDQVAFIQWANGANKINKKKSEEAVIADNGTATFTSKFNSVDGEVTSYDYAAIYPDANWKSNTNFAKVTATLPASQTLTEGNYDPAADLMMSKAILDVANKDGHGGLLQFTRLAAIGKMNLKGVTAGEKIEKVVITFENEVVNGDVTLNFTEESATYAETGSNTVTLSNGSIAANAEGTTIFFTCFPGEYSGAYSVEVTTDKATYSTNEGKSIAEEKALNFTAGNVLGFNLTVGNRVDRDLSIDYSGEYVIVAKRSTGNFFYMTPDLGSSTPRFQAVDTKVSDIASVGLNEDYVWTVAKNKDNNTYTLAEPNGKYASWSSGNSATLADEAYALTIEKVEGQEYYKIASATETSRIIALNNTAGNNYFAFYGGSGVQNLYLIPNIVETKTLQSIAVSGQTTEFTVGDTFNFDGTVTATYTGDTTGNTYTEIITEGYTVSTPDLSQAAENVEVTVTYEGKTATYTITVNKKQQGLVEDTLTTAIIGTGSSYSTWSGKSVNTAVYAGNSMTATSGNAGAIQMRSNNNNSGIVTTTSGGKITKVTITNKSGSNTLNVYAKNTAYTSATDLYSTSTQGTLVGTIKCGTATELTISGDYAYVGVRSASGAIYLTDITFTWATGETPDPTPDPEDIVAPTITIDNISDVTAAGVANATQSVGLGSPVGDWTYTVSSDATWLSALSLSDGKVYYTAAANTGAERTATVTITASCAGQTDVNKTFTITQAAGSGGGGGETKYYVKVTSAPADWSGTYLIVYENSSTIGYVFKSNDLTNKTNYTTNTAISSNQIEATSDLANYAVVVDTYNTGYSIKSVGSNNYLQGKGSNTNGTNGVTSPTIVTTFTFNSDGTVSIVNNTNHFVYNTQGYMRFYKSSTAATSGYKKMHLYKLAD